MAYTEMNDTEMRLDYAAAAAHQMFKLENCLHEIDSFFIENGPMQRGHYLPAGRTKVFAALAAKINGQEGEMVALRSAITGGIGSGRICSGYHHMRRYASAALLRHGRIARCDLHASRTCAFARRIG